ncbi:VanZ family protein [bacterium]|nr:VanZ family protein [bacterium]
MRWQRIIFWGLTGLLFFLILAASWVSESQMAGQAWIPRWLGEWADESPNFRTMLPFVPLAFLLVRCFSGKGGPQSFLWAVFLSFACLFLAEGGQVWLPQRTADPADLRWGGLGILLGSLLGAGWRRIGSALPD